MFFCDYISVNSTFIYVYLYFYSIFFTDTLAQKI